MKVGEALFADVEKSSIILLKYWLEISNEQQEKRFKSRIKNEHKQWKLSPMDLEARRRWFDYSRARDAMLKATDTDASPWHIVKNDDKEKGRLNCISHLLEQIPYESTGTMVVKLPDRDESNAYDDESVMEGRRYVPENF